MSIIYQLKLAAGESLSFEIHNRRNVNLAEMNGCTGVPDWVKIENHQCSICSQKLEDTAYCPAAFDLQDIIAQCCNYMSYTEVELSRVTDEATVTMKTDMQRALFAVIAERVLSSACTVLNNRQWTVDYYSLPITIDSLMYRSISSYLVRQFLLESLGHDPDFKLKDHLSFLDEIVKVFGTLIERVRYVSSKDANNNAIIHMITAVQFMQMERDKWLNELKCKVFGEGEPPLV